MFEGNNERPGIEERYEAACSTSTLKVHAERAGPGDMLIAAGWSEHQTGMALLRLHSEWTGAAKPRRLTPGQVTKLADENRDKEGRPDRRKAVAEAARWYANELRLLALSLKTRPTVWAQLQPWAQDKGIPEAQIAQALFHWLDPMCGHCDGHGLHKAKDAPALSARQCRACNGTGTKHVPEGGSRVLSYISHCTSQARDSISKRLRAARQNR